MGFELAHVGVNEATPETALGSAKTLENLFFFGAKEGVGSTFAGTGFEFLKKPYLGTHGHVAISTLNIHRAIAWLARKGMAVKSETAKEKDGTMAPCISDTEISGFAIHLLQK